MTNQSLWNVYNNYKQIEDIFDELIYEIDNFNGVTIGGIDVISKNDVYKIIDKHKKGLKQ